MIAILVGHPALALLPAALFAALFAHRRRALVALAALAWLAYAPYEYAMKLRILCTGECNIRVDLLLLYPLLALISLAAVLAYAWRRPSPAGLSG